MKGTIKISVLRVDFEEIEFRIVIESSACRTELDFYGYADDFRTFGQELSEFPKNINDVVLFQVGEDNRTWAYYMSVKAFCYDASGHTALRVIVDNFGDNVNGYRVEFSIKSEAASLNLFGHMLVTWNPMESKEIIWESFSS